MAAEGIDSETHHSRGQNLLTYVNDLINPITEQWDKELVIQTFLESKRTL
jgi:hypothetical protein